MEWKTIIPWRIRNKANQIIETWLRPKSPVLYKLIKYGRKNLNTPEYWDNVWETDEIQRNYEELFSLITNRIKEEQAYVIDVGCGVGRLSRILRHDSKANVTCLDFSQWACDQLSKQGFTTIVSSLPNIPLPDNTFDYAVATEVLEHLDDPEKTVLQMARIVKPGGVVMFSVPNDTLHPHEELEHQQIFTKNRMREMLSPLGDDYEIKSGELYPGSVHEFLLGIVVVK